MSTNENEIVRLPLWKSCLDHMRETGIAYGQTFNAEYFEERLRCERTKQPHFSLAISEIRRALLEDGFYLSGRGGGGNIFTILPPENNAKVMANLSRQAADALKRGVILGTNTRIDTLSESERRRHVGILERMAIKSALLSRAGTISRQHPELLK